MRLFLRIFLVATLAALASATSLQAFEKRAKPDPRLTAQIEALGKRQPEMIETALKGLAPQRPGVRDLYFVGFAGFGNQDVFRKEAERVRELFDTKFGTSGRSIILVNNPATLDRYPLATPKNLRRVLAGIGKQFDPKEDLLFLFMTSHGLPRKGFVATLAQFDFGLITPKVVMKALSAAGIQKRIVVVSACFSGQFVPALASNESLIITASAADRTSFGCTTDAEWTWFGESYFVDALPKRGSFERAFYEAVNAVAVREVFEHVKPSQPQISMGNEMRKILEELGY
jgi:hypothetical protein